nr:Chain C, PEPTIDE [Homo sapiens]
PRLYLV